MSNKTTKVVVGSLITSIIINNTRIDVQGCDSAVLIETAKEASICAGPLSPIVIGSVIIITGITTVIGIKNKEVKYEIYRSLEYLPDTWKPNTVVERVKENGKVIQRRFYGKDGKPVLDIDLTNHGTPKYHPFTYGGIHKHTFDYNKYKARSKGQELTEEEYNKYVKNFDRSKAERKIVHTINE